MTIPISAAPSETVWYRALGVWGLQIYSSQALSSAWIIWTAKVDTYRTDWQTLGCRGMGLLMPPISQWFDKCSFPSNFLRRCQVLGGGIGSLKYGPQDLLHLPPLLPLPGLHQSFTVPFKSCLYILYWPWVNSQALLTETSGTSAHWRSLLLKRCSRPGGHNLWNATRDWFYGQNVKS